MAILQRLTDEEKAERSAAKEQQRRDGAERARLEQIEEQRQAFFGTPAGLARLAYERSDDVFQYAHDVMSQKAIIVAMVGSTTAKTTADPVEILNSVCREGWELVNGSFVFVEQGQQSRDKFMASGQNVAIRGTTVGYYLFRRCEPNRRKPANPWESTDGRAARRVSPADPHNVRERLCKATRVLAVSALPIRTRVKAAATEIAPLRDSDFADDEGRMMRTAIRERVTALGDLDTTLRDISDDQAERIAERSSTSTRTTVRPTTTPRRRRLRVVPAPWVPG